MSKFLNIYGTCMVGIVLILIVAGWIRALYYFVKCRKRVNCKDDRCLNRTWCERAILSDREIHKLRQIINDIGTSEKEGEQFFNDKLIRSRNDSKIDKLGDAIYNYKGLMHQTLVGLEERIVKNKAEYVPLGERQKMIMHCFWDNGGSITGPEIMAGLKDKFGITLTKSATNSLIKTLIMRGYVELAEKRRYAYLYKALISREDLQKQEFDWLVQTTFRGDGNALVVGFMQVDADGEESEKAKEVLRKAFDE